MLDRLAPETLQQPRLKQVDLSACETRDDLVALVRSLSPDLPADDTQVSPIRGGRAPVDMALSRLDPERYGSSRNHLDGAVTRLSPYIRHGVVDLSDVRDTALERAPGKRAEKFIQQLAWRDYWQHLYAEFPDRIWHDIEPYKTGWSAQDYADDLPVDVARGETGVACIDQFIAQLLDNGYLHNHARLYVAGYVCHWRRVKWQAGARWFLAHLVDGDPASNNLSWQWVASTFSHKPYYFNLDNVAKFTGDDIDTRFKTNKPLAKTYEALFAELFPHAEPPR